jgi:primosomal protein N' (replication factor Y)
MVLDAEARRAFTAPLSLVRLPPAADPYPLAQAAASLGNALILTPSLAAAHHLVLRLKRAGVGAVLAGRGWAQGMAGATVVGARAAAWAPVGGLAAVLVIDEHDEGYAEERAPTWNARDVAVERARRAGVPCVLTSPAPSLEALTSPAARQVPSRAEERAGWPILDVVDQRREDPRSGLYSERLVRMLREGRRTVCVLNRKGRIKLLACGQCDELARCERCESAVEQDGDPPVLRCRRCGTERPPVCLACGASKFKALRLGVARVRDDLERLAGVPVAEITGDGDAAELPDATVYIGTEAVLHRVPDATGVAFLDIDQELLAPRYRAGEQAMALLVRAGRLVGGRQRGGRVLVQTRLPKHEVLSAALHGDPERLATVEEARRRALAFPPFSALAEISGPAAPAFVEAFGRPLGIDVLGPTDGRWLLRAPDHTILCGALAATARPGGRVRVEVDPVRL